MSRVIPLLLLCMAVPAVWGSEREYWISVGSYRDAANADHYYEVVSDALGRRATVRSAVTDDGIFYRVSLGPFMTREAAQTAMLSARDAGFEGTWMYSEPSVGTGSHEAVLATEPPASTQPPPRPVDPVVKPRTLPATPPTEVPDGYQLNRMRRDPPLEKS